MVRNSETTRYFVEGVLSFVKGCDTLYFTQRYGFSEDIWALFQSNENPLAYTKLSCFLPWVAEQYGLSHEGDPTNPSCTSSNGEKSPSQPCRAKLGNERECIFPFYSRGQRYDECALLEPTNFVYPVFRCPTLRSVKKRDGIDDYGDLDPNILYCLNSKFELDPSIPAVSASDSGAPVNCQPGRLATPFATCKNDCPGGKYVIKQINNYFLFPVRGSAITAVGTVLFLASAQTGLGLLSAAGDTSSKTQNDQVAQTPRPRSPQSRGPWRRWRPGPGLLHGPLVPGSLWSVLSPDWLQERTDLPQGLLGKEK